MEEINSSSDLRAAILVLETKRNKEAILLKKEFHHAYELMKPINLIKSTVKEVGQSQDLKNNLINTAIGLTAGYISKALFEGVSHSPLRKLVGTALMFGIVRMITKNPEVVKTVGNGLMNVIRKQ